MTFELWRQDDNGRCFLVGRFPTRSDAEQRLEDLARSQHKQIYWIAELTDSTEGMPC